MKLKLKELELIIKGLNPEIEVELPITAFTSKGNSIEEPKYSSSRECWISAPSGKAICITLDDISKIVNDAKIAFNETKKLDKNGIPMNMFRMPSNKMFQSRNYTFDDINSIFITILKTFSDWKL